VTSFPDYIHWFSWHSRISLELPVGFEEKSEDPETHSVSYADDLDEDDPAGALVLAGITPVAADLPDAYRELAGQSALIRPDAVRNRRTLVVDGVPAEQNVLEYHDDDLGMAVLRHETFAQIDNLIFSISAIAPLDKADEYQDDFDHAVSSARFVLLPAAPQYAGSVAHEGTLVSFEIPDGWEMLDVAARQFRLFGPSHPEHNDYRPTFSVTLGEPQSFGDEWMESFVAASRDHLAQTYRGFGLVSSEILTLSSLADAHLTWYHWEPEPGLAFVQLQAQILVDAYRLYLINAATVLPLSDTYTPVFEGILRSIRVLSAPP
jgi:hypothetical protein